jgi:hypothetical protein
MSFLQSIWTDLVEKRLLPVVALLVVAIIAVPFVLGGKKDSSSSTPIAAVPPTPQSDGDPGDLTAVKRVIAVARHGAPGIKRSPFTQPKAAAAKSNAPSSTQTPATTPGNPGGGGGSTPPYIPPSTPPYVPPTTPKAPASPSDYRVTLRVGQAGNLQVHKDVERLTPLPSTVDPFMVFMGVTDNGKTAVFLLSSDAKATGDGTCKPSPASCQTVEMKAQDVEFFDVDTSGTGSDPVQYELDLTRIIKTASSGSSSSSGSGSSTAALHTGQQVVDRSRAAGSPALSGYSYDPHTGALVRRLPTLASQLASIARRSGL